MRQHYRVAGLRVEMDSFGRTELQARPYMVSPAGEADIVICSERERVKKSSAEHLRGHVRVFSDRKQFLPTIAEF